MSRYRIAVFSVIILIAVVVQTTVLPIYLAEPFKPDLLLIIIVYFALHSTFQSGTPLSWLLGLLKDVFSGLYLGLNAFTFLIIFLFIKSVADRLYADSDFLFVVTVCMATLACVVVDFFLLIMFTQTSGILYSMLYGLIPHLLINAFVASLAVLIPGFKSRLETP